METLNSYPLFMIIAACDQIEEWAKTKIYQFNYMKCFETLRYIEIVLFDVIKCHKDYDKLTQMSKDKVCCLQMRIKQIISILLELNERIRFYKGDLAFHMGKEPVKLIERFHRIVPMYETEYDYIEHCRRRFSVDHDLITKSLRRTLDYEGPLPMVNEPEEKTVEGLQFKNPPDQLIKTKVSRGFSKYTRRKSVGNAIRPSLNMVLFDKEAGENARKPVLEKIPEGSREGTPIVVKKLDEKLRQPNAKKLPDRISLDSNEFLSSTLVSSKNATQKEVGCTVTAQSILESQPLRKIRSSFRKVITFGRDIDPIVMLDKDPYLRSIQVNDIDLEELNKRFRTLRNISVPKGIIEDFHELNKENQYIGVLCYKNKKKKKIAVSHCIVSDSVKTSRSSLEQTKELLKKKIIELNLAQIGFIVKTELLRDQNNYVMNKLQEGQKIVPEYFLAVVGGYSTEFYFCRFHQRYFVTKFPIKISESYLQMVENVKVAKKESYCIYRIDPLNSSIN